MHETLHLRLAADGAPRSRPRERRGGAFSFAGTLTEPCLGCGTAPGSFTGTFTGVVDGHAYVAATLTMTVVDSYWGGAQWCPLAIRWDGTFEVSDATRTDSFPVTMIRYGYLPVVVVLHDGTQAAEGNAAGTLVSPDGIGTCGEPIEGQLAASGVFLP